MLALVAAIWIGAPGNGSPAFAKTFSVTGDVRRAVLRIAAPGFCEARLDGEKVGDSVLDPVPTDFSRRVYFTEHPLVLTPGVHEILVLLGHGWYDQRAISAWDNHRDIWRADPCLWAEIAIDYVGEVHAVVGTDVSWRQAPSPLAWDDFREGEIIDPGFVLPRSGLGAHAVAVRGPAGRLQRADFPPARVIRTLQAVRVWQPKAGGWMFDFGEDIAGWTRMTFAGGKRGDVVTIRYDERICPDGEPAHRVERTDVKKVGRKELWPDDARVIDCYVRTVGSTNVLLGGAAQQDRFVLAGKEPVQYEPRFTYKGFRYVWVTGVRARPAAVACEVRTDFAETGSFSCSDDDFNALMRMADRAYKANFTDGVPTDCPHREKNGWTGDAQMISEFAQYAYENTAAYVKWIRDLVDAQRADGNMPGIVPSGGWGVPTYADRPAGFGPVWGAALAIVPWNLYVYRDSSAGIDIAYGALTRFIAYEESHLDAAGMVCHGLGDWIPVRETDYVGPTFCGSAYLYGIEQIAARIAAMRRRTDDAAKYAALATKMYTRFNEFHHKGNGLYGGGRQTEQALALNFGLVPEPLRQAAEARLVAVVERDGGRFNGGIVGTKHVFRALSRAGRTDMAFAMLKAPGEPGFQHWREMGGTALWEDWWTGFSRNHVMFGDFACWAYQYLAGIRLPESDNATAAVPFPGDCGFRSVVIAPDCILALDWVKASVKGSEGMISSEWHRDGDEIELKVRLPPKTHARIILPQPDNTGRRIHEKRTAGESVFRFPSGNIGPAACP